MSIQQPKNELCLVSDYVEMPDGVCLAVSTWLSKKAERCPAVLITTRYWRAADFHDNSPDSQAYYPLAVTLADNGYTLVIADARGTGASFGTRQAETDSTEIADIEKVIDWVAEQPWCDGRVATTGCSYMAITTLYSLVSAPKALEVGVCVST